MPLFETADNGVKPSFKIRLFCFLFTPALAWTLLWSKLLHVAFTWGYGDPRAYEEDAIIKVKEADNALTLRRMMECIDRNTPDTPMGAIMDPRLMPTFRAIAYAIRQELQAQGVKPLYLPGDPEAPTNES